MSKYVQVLLKQPSHKLAFIRKQLFYVKGLAILNNWNWPSYLGVSNFERELRAVAAAASPKAFPPWRQQEDQYTLAKLAELEIEQSLHSIPEQFAMARL